MKSEPICGANAVAALFARRAADVQRLFYLRDQPPLFNALLGLALKLFPNAFSRAMQIAIQEALTGAKPAAAALKDAAAQIKPILDKTPL